MTEEKKRPLRSQAWFGRQDKMGFYYRSFLKNSGFFVISFKASCIDSTAQHEAVFAREDKKLQEQQLKPREQASPRLTCPPARLTSRQVVWP